MMAEINLEEWMKEQDEIFEKPEEDKDALYDKAKEVYEKFNGESNVEILWRVQRAAYKAAAVAEVKKDKNKQKKILLEAIEYGKKALALTDQNGEVHCWYAYACGKMSDHLGVKERIQMGHTVKTHLEQAIKYKPNEFAIYYTYGRWCMEVAKLTWIEKKIAATFFDTPPEATYADAVEKFEKVDQLKPEWMPNLYYMGKSLVELKKYKEAISVLDKGAKCTINFEEDQVVNPLLLQLQAKYASYR